MISFKLRRARENDGYLFSAQDEVGWVDVFSDDANVKALETALVQEAEKRRLVITDKLTREIQGNLFFEDEKTVTVTASVMRGDVV